MANSDVCLWVVYFMLCFTSTMCTRSGTSVPPGTTETMAMEEMAMQPGYEGRDIVRFSKHMYSVLGTKDQVELAKDFRVEYDALNKDGKLGLTLDALFEMRLEDIMISARHVKKMREVLNILSASSGP